VIVVCQGCKKQKLEIPEQVKVPSFTCRMYLRTLIKEGGIDKERRYPWDVPAPRRFDSEDIAARPGGIWRESIAELGGVDTKPFAMANQSHFTM
jgi:hypothetical protein